MRTIKSILNSWLQKDVYTRLFFPILILTFTVGLFRYHLLITSERLDAMTRAQGEMRQTARHVEMELHLLDPDTNKTEIHDILETEINKGEELGVVHLILNGHQFSYLNKRITSNVPPWFIRFVDFKPFAISHVFTMRGGQIAQIDLESSGLPATNRIWRKVVIQFLLSLVLICGIYTLLYLILRSNAKTLRHLEDITARFQHGEHSVRMQIKGSQEARALASTFNNMADDIERLLTTLRQSQREQSEQFHFTLQLLTVLPIPIFFKDKYGICRGVNAAWAMMFGMAAKDAIGKPIAEILPLIEQLGINAHSGYTDQDAKKFVTELTLPAASGDLDVIYYQATYTNVEGIDIGSIGAFVDISERKQIQSALAEEKERVETTLDSIGDAVISTDFHGRILTLNRAAQHLTGWGRDAAKNLLLTEVFELENSNQAALLSEFIQQIHTKKTALHASNLLLLCCNGKQIEIDYTAAPIRHNNGATIGCVLIFRDLSEKRRLLRQLSWQAGHDVLTGLVNRSSLNLHLQQAIAFAKEEQKFMAVCLIDLDHFQEINEQYGNEFADKLLQQVARRLEKNAGGNPVARLGGDEFVVLLQGQNDIAETDKNLVLLLAELSLPYQIDQRQISMSASIGVSMYPRDDHSPDALLRYADQAMYQAKISGRNRYHLFDAQRDQEVRTHHNQRARIRQALHDDELVLYYQPKVDMRDGRVIGMEALLRWNHPERGIVGPMEFLPLIEHTDLIIDIGEWVMEKALAQLALWSAAGHHWVVSVNIAARHFQSNQFTEKLRNILLRFPDVPAHSLEIEVLESAAIQDIQYVRDIMLACQQLGVRFALDDFGTGYSSLSYLKRLPANILKIDQSFVRDMLEDQDDLALVGAVIGLAKAFKREVIAEGVETAEHGVALMRIGCHLAQGYGVARPMPVSAVSEWATAYRAPDSWLNRDIPQSALFS